jgi:DNA-binding NarL/FixJ family response regulator
MAPIRVLVADENTIFRRGLCRLLSGDGDIEVVGEAESSPDLLAQVESLCPDVVVLDLLLSGSSGVQTALEIRRRFTNPPRILILSAYDDEEHLSEALRAGVHGFLLKTAPYEVLVEAVREVYEGRKLLTPEQITRVVGWFQELARDRARDETGLSDTELQILECLAGGETYEEIADHLYLSERTVKRKVQSAIEKMGAKSRTEVVAMALRRGLI